MAGREISEMVADCAWDDFKSGGTADERSIRLTRVCTAWNYACAPEDSRVGLLNAYLAEYREWNPSADAEECRALRESLERLIQAKIRKYPHITKRIISCELTVKDGQEQIDVLAVDKTL